METEAFLPVLLWLSALQKQSGILCEDEAPQGAAGWLHELHKNIPAI